LNCIAIILILHYKTRFVDDGECRQNSSINNDTRNYSKVPSGTIHEHDFKIISQHKNGTIPIPPRGKFTNMPLKTIMYKGTIQMYPRIHSVTNIPLKTIMYKGTIQMIPREQFISMISKLFQKLKSGTIPKVLYRTFISMISKLFQKMKMENGNNAPVEQTKSMTLSKMISLENLKFLNKLNINF